MSIDKYNACEDDTELYESETGYLVLLKDYMEEKQALKQRLIDELNNLRDGARRGCYEANIAGNMDESKIFAGYSAAYTVVVELIEKEFSEP